ncbi:MAG: rhodanese-like domain-containing protein, partial [Sediminibacterium sp.]|nr:rhodanese-like domain-containing protein [Sediminibacterium sp.]
MLFMKKTLAAYIQSKECTLVDVRTLDEFQQAHLPNAIHIPLDEVPNRLQEISAFVKPIILYCHSGYR